ncbi:MAG: hypothetical protein KAY13_04655, partial [Zoogloea sp.]|nr:hypothetical protein [Zoogloea sp.]
MSAARTKAKLSWVWGMLAVRRKPAAFRIQGAVFIISNKYAKGTAMSEQNTNFEEFYGYKYEELTLGQSAVYA